MIMRTTSLPLVFVVLLFPLLSLWSCTNDDVHDSQTTDGDATAGGCLDNTGCESGSICQNGDCVSDDPAFAADVEEDSTGTTDAADGSSFTNDTAEEDDADEGPGIPDAVDAAQADVEDVAEPDEDSTIPEADEDSTIPDAVEETDGANEDDDDATDASDESGSTDTVAGDNDTGSGNVDDGDLESCKNGCAADDLGCTGQCGGSPLCLAQCAGAYTDCNDACDAAFGG